jgi:glycosyltransferase involved in cell wall biosynthesis
MKVMVVHNRYRSEQPSGENRVVDQETRLLVSAGVEVSVHERSSDEIASMSSLDRAMLPARVVWSDRERRSMRKAVRLARPDVVHVHNTFPLLSPSILVACAEERVPVVMTLHNFRLACANGSLFRDGRPCERCVGRRPWAAVGYGCYRDSRAMTLPVAAMIAVHGSIGTWTRHVSRFIVMSEFGRRMMVRVGLPPHKLIVKPNSVEEPAVRRSGPGEHLLFLGRLAPEKGLDLLASAWSTTGATMPLLIAGEGPLRDPVERWAATTPGVRFLGRRTPQECGLLLSRARGLVVPSRWYETFALVAVEAFAAGVPPIAPRHGPFPDLIDEGRNGFLFEPGDAVGLSRAIGRLARDEALATRTGNAARASYEQRFTGQHNLAALLSVYEDAIERRAA